MLSLEEIKELVKVLEDSSLNKLELKYEDGKVLLEKTVTAINEPVVNTTVAPMAMPAKTGEQIVEITAPMVGTFYSAPSPDAEAFVKVGQTVKEGDVVCIVEAMKLMNEIESEVSGKIVEICVSDGQPVEFGQVLMYVE